MNAWRAFAMVALVTVQRSQQHQEKSYDRDMKSRKKQSDACLGHAFSILPVRQCRLAARQLIGTCCLSEPSRMQIFAPPPFAMQSHTLTLMQMLHPGRRRRESTDRRERQGEEELRPTGEVLPKRQPHFSRRPHPLLCCVQPSYRMSCIECCW